MRPPAIIADVAAAEAYLSSDIAGSNSPWAPADIS